MTEVLNLYPGAGGNRSDLENVSVTAVELDPQIAEIYADRFPNDTVIVGDAHEYLLNNYKRFDFIWSSPVCITHSSLRQNLAVRFRGTPAVYPDMSLYQQIIFLKYNASCKWVIENVVPYYEPLIKPTAKIQRHLFWSNFDIPALEVKKDKLRTAQIPDLQIHHGIDLSKYKVPNKRQILRNCTLREIGRHIFDAAFLKTESLKCAPDGA